MIGRVLAPEIRAGSGGRALQYGAAELVQLEFLDQSACETKAEVVPMIRVRVEDFSEGIYRNTLKGRALQHGAAELVREVLAMSVDCEESTVSVDREC